MTYKVGTQKKQNTSFQKRERGFYVFGNSYFGSPIRNGLTHIPSTFNHATRSSLDMQEALMEK